MLTIYKVLPVLSRTNSCKLSTFRKSKKLIRFIIANGQRAMGREKNQGESRCSSVKLNNILSTLVNSCQLLSTFVNSCQLLSTLVNSCQLLSSLVNSCQLLSTVNSCQLSTLVNSCQFLSIHSNEFIVLDYFLIIRLRLSPIHNWILCLN